MPMYPIGIASPRVTNSASSDPTVNSDTAAGFRPGDVWINTASGNEFRCISHASGAAIWRHVPRVWQSGTAFALANPGHTNNTKLTSALIPANSMGTHGRLDIEEEWSVLTSGNNKTINLYFGAADDLTGTLFSGLAVTTNLANRVSMAVQNKGATNSQRGVCPTGGGVGFGGFASAAVTASIDTTAAAYVVFAAQLANGADTLTLESYRIILTRPDIGP